jgi:MFS family permease
MSTSEELAGNISPATRHEERKVLAGTLVGTTIEWYDFFIYAQAAGLVLASLYFAPLSQESSGLAQIVAWASLGISFLFRPLGAIVAGHLGDRLGRKMMLVFTLVLMGAATALIGVLPTYAQVGWLAPILLILLRVAQGFAVGGEWGGSMIIVLESAPQHRRGFFSAWPNTGGFSAQILITLVMLYVYSLSGQLAPHLDHAIQHLIG